MWLTLVLVVIVRATSRGGRFVRTCTLALAAVVISLRIVRILHLRVSTPRLHIDNVSRRRLKARTAPTIPRAHPLALHFLRLLSIYAGCFLKLGP